MQTALAAPPRALAAPPEQSAAR